MKVSLKIKIESFLLIIIVCALLFFPTFISEQFHSYRGFTSTPVQKSIRDYSNTLEWALATGLIEENSLAYWIINCESRWREWECNNGFNCRAGIGLWQIVVSTWNDALEKMSLDENTPHEYMPEKCWQLMAHPISYEKREIIFDGECNFLVGLWLLENEGSQHWGTKEDDWGSYRCWNNVYINK